jgi:hypothetical protein
MEEKSENLKTENLKIEMPLTALGVATIEKFAKAGVSCPPDLVLKMIEHIRQTGPLVPAIPENAPLSSPRMAEGDQSLADRCMGALMWQQSHKIDVCTTETGWGCTNQMGEFLSYDCSGPLEAIEAAMEA